MGKPTMTARSKNYQDKYWTFCDEIRAGFNRTSKFDSCTFISVTANFGTEDATLWGHLHRKKPDATNILKGVEDALLIDDSGNHVMCNKFWGPEDSVMVTLHGVR